MVHNLTFIQQPRHPASLDQGWQRI
jgi:hypothetical protein